MNALEFIDISAVATEEANVKIISLQDGACTSNSTVLKRHLSEAPAQGGTEAKPAKQGRYIRHSDVQNVIIYQVILLIDICVLVHFYYCIFVLQTVRKYLDCCVKGLKFLGLYNNGFFNGTVRSELAEYIVDCELNADSNKL